ncbi:MAG: c-type cytochrome [Rhodocyclaceae bacterium]|nr:c-type cytochrome [Rhodocyclaceae bacterium]
MKIKSLLLSLTLLLPASLFAAEAQEIVKTVCAACHGVDGNSTEPANPKLAGMDQEYLMRQLKAFAAGKRRDDTMSAIIATVDPGDFVGLAAYYGPQKPVPGKVLDAQLAAKGRMLYEDGNTESGVPACAGCHQPNGKGNARFPRLAGQHQTYVLKQLADYKSGRRATDPLMTTVGKRLTTDESKALAEYIAGL